MLASTPCKALANAACSRLLRLQPTAVSRKNIFQFHAVSVETANRTAADRSTASEATTSKEAEPTELEQLVRGGARVTRAAHLFWAQFVRPGDFVVDATSGNGGDTLWLSRAVGPTGRVIAMDIQEEAIKSTRDLLEWELPAEMWPRLELVEGCHTKIKEHAGTAKPKLVCFNLGYLPWSDKGLMTRPETTTAAVRAALDILAPEGVLSVVSYTGHEGGQTEHDAVLALLAELPSQEWTVCNSRILNRPKAPILTLAIKAMPKKQ